MDTFPSKGSRKSCVTDPSSRDRVASLEGNRRVQKVKNSQKSSSDSSSCYSETWGEDTLTFELGWKSSSSNVGTPIKRLIAQEMSKENESRRRSPCIIARLMGLDGLPPQNPSHKQQRTTLFEKDQRNSMLRGQLSSRKSSKEEQEFKDVLEVLDVPKVESSRCSFQGSRNADFNEAEMTLIRQKFMEAKRFSTDKKLHHSKEFHDALEVPDSNKDLLLNFLQHPDSLFTKHLQDLQSVVPELHCSHVSSMKSSNCSKHDGSIKDQKADKEALGRGRSRSHRKYRAGGCPSHPHSRQVAHNNLLELPSFELEEKSNLQPTRIIVLKPNLGKTQTANTNFLSSSSASDDPRADCRLPCTRNREPELWDKKKVDEDESFMRHKPRDSGVIAKDITSQIRASHVKSGSMNFPASGSRGYAGDESSSGSDSASDSELLTLTKKATFSQKNHLQSSSSQSTESSVRREAKKRLSERWKLTQRSEQAREISRSSTLAEMLAVSDRRALASFDYLIFEGHGKNFENDRKRTDLAEPLGISSRDGWKNEHVRDFSKLRSLPASSSAIGHPKMLMHRESPRLDKTRMTEEVLKRERNWRMMGNHDNREAFLTSNSRYSSKKSQSSCNTSPEINFNPRQCKNLFIDDLSFEQNLEISETHTSSSVDVISDTMYAVNAVSSEPSCQDFSVSSTSENDSTSDHDVLRSQGRSSKPPNAYVPELPSLASTKEGDQPSPVSVLETSFPDDFSSSSECFESLSADLHGLRMQLQLLKLEAGAYEEGTMRVSSDEDDADQEKFIDLTDEKTIAQNYGQDWKSLYLIDVLINSRFNDSAPDAFMATWYSSDSPVSPYLFDGLEKKYSNLTHSSRSERKFLFDSINWELIEIFKKFADLRPWVKPTRVGPKWDINELQDTLRKLVARKAGKACKVAREKVLETETGWLNLEDDTEIIGWEIEKLLTDELIAEIAAAI